MPPPSPFDMRNKFAHSYDSGNSQHRKDSQTGKNDLLSFDLNRTARKAIDKVEEMYASIMASNLKNSFQSHQGYILPIFTGQLYSAPGPAFGYNNATDRPDIFGFRAEVCNNCLSINCFEVLFPTGAEGYASASSHKCDPNRVIAVKSLPDKSRWMNENRKEVVKLLKEKIIKSTSFLNALVAIKLSDPPPQIITIPNPTNPRKPIHLGKHLQMERQLSLSINDYSSWAWRVISVGMTNLEDEEVPKFLQIADGATFAVVEVRNGLQGEQLARSFYFMYLANESTDFEALLRNRISSMREDTIPSINRPNDKTAKRQSTGLQNADFADHIVVTAYEGRVCEKCLDSYPIATYYREGEHSQARHETEHQCHPNKLAVAKSIPNKDDIIAYRREKLPELVYNLIETQDQLLAFELSMYPPNSIEVLPFDPNHYLARVTRDRQTIITEEEKLDFLHRTGSSTCGFFNVHLVQKKETGEYYTLPYLIAINVAR
jgi:hypothetical protein